MTVSRRTRDVEVRVRSPRPFIKWAGGKRQLLPELRKHVPASYNRYLEPFLGGGALFFDLGPGAAVLGDVNERLVRMYCAVRDEVNKVIVELRKYPHEETFYKKLRSCFDIDQRTDHEVAAWFLYLNKTSFNGVYRVNRKGEYNVPFDKTKKNVTICDDANLRACSEALQGTRIMAGDFEDVAREARSGDFVYFDPPYVPLSATSNFTAYAKEPFGPKEQVRLRDVALGLHARGVQVLLSNSSSDVVRDLYGAAPFVCHEVDAKRAVNSDGTKRGNVKELIIGFMRR
jgi:DNA adenine methylase